MKMTPGTCSEEILTISRLSRRFLGTSTPLEESDGAVFSCLDKKQLQRIQHTTLTRHIKGKFSFTILQSPVRDSMLK